MLKEILTSIPNWVNWLCGGIGIGLIIAFIIFCSPRIKNFFEVRKYFKDIEKNQKRFGYHWTFEKIFGVNGYKAKENIPEYQAIVDKKLEMFAVAFQSKAIEDRELSSKIQQASKENTEILKMDIIVDEYERNQKELISIKEEFWTARWMAKYLGFEVRRKYTDYLK
jgi:hypothetical protein